jgi:Bacterial Ig-like domain/Bacterial Ig domain
MFKKFLPLIIVATFGLIACQSQAPITLKISNPGTVLSTNGTLTVQVDVTGGKPESVTLLKNGAPFATVPAPYQYAWNTTTEPEGTYFLTAKVTRGGQGFSASEEFTSPPRTVVVDRTAPTVVSRTPAPDQADVDVKGSISVTFSEPVDSKTVEDSAVDLIVENLSVQKTLALSDDFKTLEIKPSGLPYINKPTSYSVALTKKIKDNAGNLVKLPSDEWKWRIPGWQTLGNVSISHNATGLSAYSLALDLGGNPVVAWSEANGVFVKRWTGSAWILVGPGAINATPANSLTSIGVDSKNSIFLAYIEQSSLFVKQWNGSSWNLMGAKGINEISNNPVSVSAFTLSLDQNGLPIIAWGNADDIFAKRWSGSEWVLIGSGSVSRDLGSKPGKPIIASSRNGNLFIAWQDYLDSNYKIFVKKWVGSTWETLGSGAINQEFGKALWPSLVIDRERRVLGDG